ncbi:MATE family efflux transporter [Fusobacterium ulcerans]|uniref:MATE family efflux transporter n=1 Tax=Fusobacterium ulcerans TaxID=861 RepID=UPI001D0B57F6|nr:MATE family efflux transporter [Fusobacterium ulcerans]MCB8566518.1 MATE family efflux transporter [Fusobacterium ulcerans]MCB8650677.1 MATE family efflux transporter [Fusobacterium ulcerans]
MNDKKSLFTDAPISEAVTKMALPCVISSLILIIYNMADTFFVGQTQNAFQVAAVSLTNPVFVLFIAAANLLGIGGSAMISILLGQNKKEKVKSVSSFCCYASIIIGILSCLLILIFMNPLLKLLGSSPDTYQFSKDYLFYIALGGPFILFSNAFGHIVRGEGASNISMIGGLIGTIVNIILDPIFILTLNMGTAGAAIATVIGNIAGCLYYLWYFNKGESSLSLNPCYLAGEKKIMLQTTNIGIPSGINSALMSVSTILFNNVVVSYGDTPLAAMGIVTKIYLLIVFIHMGISNGVQPLLGYNYGCGNHKRFFSILKFSALCTVVLGTILSGVCIVFRYPIIRLFIDNTSVINYGAKMLMATSLAGPVLGILFLCITSIQALNNPFSSTMLSVCRQGIFFIPLLYTLNFLFGLTGVIYTQTVTDYLTVIISVFFLKSSLKKMKNL